MPAQLSILDEAIVALTALLRSLCEDDPLGSGGLVPVFREVYEQGDTRDRTRLPYAVVHAHEERATSYTTCRVHVEVPLFIEVEFPRPPGTAVFGPARRHRQLLAHVQSALVADDGRSDFGVEGVTDCLYHGRGSLLAPLDDAGRTDEEPSSFAFACEFALRYRFHLGVPTSPT